MKNFQKDNHVTTSQHLSLLINQGDTDDSYSETKSHDFDEDQELNLGAVLSQIPPELTLLAQDFNRSCEFEFEKCLPNSKI